MSGSSHGLHGLEDMWLGKWIFFLFFFFHRKKLCQDMNILKVSWVRSITESADVFANRNTPCVSWFSNHELDIQRNPTRYAATKTLKYSTVAGVAADLIRKEGSSQRSGTLHSSTCAGSMMSTVSISLATESWACVSEGVRCYKSGVMDQGRREALSKRWDSPTLDFWEHEERWKKREAGALYFLRTLNSQPARTHVGAQICILIWFKILIKQNANIHTELRDDSGRQYP